MNERRVVPLEEAIERIGPDEYIHTFMGGGMCLVGADHKRDDLIDAMRRHGVEESGKQACAMRHTLVIVNYPTWDDDRTTPLFIQAKPRPQPSDPPVAHTEG